MHLPVVLRNWALFIEGDQVKWTFGLSGDLSSPPEEGQDEGTNEQITDDQEFQLTTVRFIQSLQAIGRELYDNGVASIKLAHPSRSTLMANEVFIVNLSDQFFFIISDLTVTARLIQNQETPFEVEQIINAVLVGQASILYSTLILVQDEGGYDTDQIFRELLVTLEVDKRHDLQDLVHNGRCALSPLRMDELLLFHYLLREYFESRIHQVSITSKAWALMVDSSGTDIPLSWMPPKDPYLLGNFLGAIYSYVQALFGTKPAAIVFGGADLIYLQFFGGTKYFLAASNPQTLAKDPDFVRMIMQVPSEKFKDIEDAVHEFILSQVVQLVKQKLTDEPLGSLLTFYQEVNRGRFVVHEKQLKDVRGIGPHARDQLALADVHSLEDLVVTDNASILAQLPNDTHVTPKRLNRWREEANQLLDKPQVQVEVVRDPGAE